MNHNHPYYNQNLNERYFSKELFFNLPSKVIKINSEETGSAKIDFDKFDDCILIVVNTGFNSLFYKQTIIFPKMAKAYIKIDNELYPVAW